MARTKVPSVCGMALAFGIFVVGLHVVAAAETLRSSCSSKDISEIFTCTIVRSTNVYVPYEVDIALPGSTKSYDIRVLGRGLGSASLSMELVFQNEVVAYSKGDLSEASLSLPFENRKAGVHTLRVKTDSLYSDFSLTVSSAPVRTSLAATDRAALRLLYMSCCKGGSVFDGSREHQSDLCDKISNWIVASVDSPDDFCNSAPNQCDADGRIVKAFLRTENGKTPFSESCNPVGVLSNFTTLQTLDISNQRLNWSLKQLIAAVGTLPKLEKLYVHNTQLTGNLDASGCELVKALPELNVLWAGKNQLVGKIPSCFIAGWQNSTKDQKYFKQLRLNNNGLGPKIPNLFDPFNRLEVLDLEEQIGEYDSLGGEIPKTLALLPNLVVLNLAANEFYGTIPELPTTLQELVLSKNRLSGTLPANLGAMQRLTLLHIGLGRPDPDLGTKISGPLPAGFERLPKLVFAYLSNNTLSGTLDREWNMPALQRLSLSFNRFTGPIPASLASGCPQLRFLRLGNNQLSGTLDAYAAAIPAQNYVVGLNLTMNQLTGTVPKALNKLAVFSDVSYPVTGEFDYLTKAPITYKNVLVLTYNKFTGAFPMWILDAMAGLNNVIVQMFDSVPGDSNSFSCPPAGTKVGSAVYTSATQPQQLYMCRDSSGKLVEVSSLLTSTGSGSGSGSGSTMTASSGSSDSGSNSGTTTSSSSTSGTTSSPRSSSTAGKKKSKDLNDGAIAGIVIACIIAAIIIAGIAYCLVKKQRQQAKFEQFQGPQSGVKGGPAVVVN